MDGGSANSGLIPAWVGAIALNLISAVIFEYFRPVLPFLNRRAKQNKSDPIKQLIPNREISTATNYDYGSRRRKAKEFLGGAALYLMHILAVWLTLALTLMCIDSSTPNLRDARLIGGYLPRFTLSADILTWQGLTSVLFASVLCYAVGWIIAVPFVFTAEYFGYFDVRLSALVTACCFSYILLGIHVGWIFTQAPYLRVWVTVGIFFAVVFTVSALTNKKH